MSLHNELPGGPPLLLSKELANVVASSSQRFDIAIADIPFRLWPSPEDPHVRDYRLDQKEQFDTSGEAGENSFGNWWLRSQSTFHGGAGQDYIDTTGAAESRMLFASSNQLSPHTAGELAVTAQVSRDATYGASDCELVQWSTVDKIVFLSNSTNQVTVRNIPSLTLDQNVTVGAAGIPAAMTSDGERVFVALNDKIYRINPGSPATVTNTHTNLTFSGSVKLGFAKDRLICCIGPKVYELNPNESPVKDMAAVSPHYTNKASTWRYTSIADGPNGIYLAGYSGHQSYMSMMTISESSGSLILGQPTVQITTPPAEIIRDIFFYVSSHFALATSSGVRVGSFTPYGQPQIGPLSVEGSACYSLGASRELIWAGGVNTIWRIDLATPIDQAGRFAHARYTSSFLASGTEHVNSLVVYPGTVDRVLGTASSGNLLYQPTLTFNTNGTLTTSWVRFDTVEPKQLHYVRVDGEFPVITGVSNVVTVTVETDLGESSTFQITGGKSTYEFSTASLKPAQLFRLVFTIRDKDAGQGVILRSWQMKALPAPRIFGEHVLPLACYDEEEDRNGSKHGYKGFAVDRLRALEDLAASNERITVTDRLLDESYQAIITRCQFRQDDKPASQDAIGGIVSIVLRKV